MTNCNDGKWHGWNGGECPVHPKTVVEVVLHDDTDGDTPLAHFKPGETSVLAERLKGCWEHRTGLRHIIAFRVIKEHKEPREFWICLDEIFDSEDDARIQYGSGPEIIHVKEVLE